MSNIDKGFVATGSSAASAQKALGNACPDPCGPTEPLPAAPVTQGQVAGQVGSVYSQPINAYRFANPYVGQTPAPTPATYQNISGTQLPETYYKNALAPQAVTTSTIERVDVPMYAAQKSFTATSPADTLTPYAGISAAQGTAATTGAAPIVTAQQVKPFTDVTTKAIQAGQVTGQGATAFTQVGAQQIGAQQTSLTDVVYNAITGQPEIVQADPTKNLAPTNVYESAQTTNQYNQMFQQAMTAASTMMTGEIPADVKAVIERNAAEQGISRGLFGQQAQGLTARDLGLTSYDIAKQGMANAQNLAQLAEQRRQYDVTYNLNRYATYADREQARQQLNNTQALATKQFNAELQSRTDLTNQEKDQAMQQFNAGLKTQTEQFNSSAVMQAALANQDKETALKQFDKSLEVQRQQFNTDLAARTDLSNEERSVAVQEFNKNLDEQRNQFNATIDLQAQVTNAEDQIKVAQFNAQQTQQMELYNKDSLNQINQFNTTQVQQQKEFIAQLQQQTALSNAERFDAMTQFNQQQKAANDQFTAELEYNRRQYNATASNNMEQFSATLKSTLDQANVANYMKAQVANQEMTYQVATYNADKQLQYAAFNQENAFKQQEMNQAVKEWEDKWDEMTREYYTSVQDKNADRAILMQELKTQAYQYANELAYKYSVTKQEGVDITNSPIFQSLQQAITQLSESGFLGIPEGTTVKPSAPMYPQPAPGPAPTPTPTPGPEPTPAPMPMPMPMPNPYAGSNPPPTVGPQYSPNPPGARQWTDAELEAIQRGQYRV